MSWIDKVRWLLRKAYAGDPKRNRQDECTRCGRTGVQSGNAPNDELTWCSVCERWYCPRICFTSHKQFHEDEQHID